MNRNKKASKIGTAAAILASVILSGTTVFAYTPMQTTHQNDSSPSTEDAISFIDSDSQNSCFLTSDIYFETEDHEIVPVSNSDLDSRAILCSHKFKSGYADRHYSQSNGGCIVKRYTASICTKCNHIEMYDCINTITYAKCIHK